MIQTWEKEKEQLDNTVCEELTGELPPLVYRKKTYTLECEKIVIEQKMEDKRYCQ